MNYCLEWSQCFEQSCWGYSTNLAETLYPYHTTPQTLAISVLHFHQPIFRKFHVHLKSRGTYLCLAYSTLCFPPGSTTVWKTVWLLLLELSSISFYAGIQTYVISPLIHVSWIVDHTTVMLKGTHWLISHGCLPCTRIADWYGGCIFNL